MKRAVAVLALACALPAGCGGTPDRQTVTAAKAPAQVDNYPHQTITATPRSATFTTTTSNDNSSCVATGTDSGFTGQVTAQVGYETDTANPDLGALRTYWTNQGYTVSGGSTYVDAYTEDNYHLSAIYHADQHKLDLSGSSPCVWPNGTSPTPAN